MRDAIINVMATSHDYAMATWRISRRLRPETTRAVRAELIRMERDGLVIRELRYCTANNIVWKLTEKGHVRTI